MKKLFIALIIICGYIPAVFAQIQSQASSFDVDGVTVIFRPTVKPVINVRVFYRGGVSNYSTDKAGIERFALAAAVQCGTQKYKSNAFRDEADKFGINMHYDAAVDYGDIEMECIGKYFNEGWDLLTQAVLNPVFENDEFELLRNKLISSVNQVQSNPDARVAQLILKNAFENTPYATDPDGDEEVLKKLTPLDIKTYYSGILNKNQIFIVVAGNISKDDLIARVKESFAGLPAKDYKPVVYTEPIWDDNKLLTEKRELSTNYINAIMNAPQVNSPDDIPYKMGIAALGGALFSVLRNQLNLSYDPGAHSVTGKMSYGIMDISTTSPKEAVKAMADLLTRVKSNGISNSGLQELKSNFITTYYMRQQSSSAITVILGEAEILGSYHDAEALPGLVGRTTADQIQNAMNKYIVGLRWSYLGDQDQADEAASAFAKKIK